MVARGEVELALFNLVELPPGVRLAGPVPAPLQDYTSYETAVLANGGAAPSEAQAFIKLDDQPIRPQNVGSGLAGSLSIPGDSSLTHWLELYRSAPRYFANGT